MKIQNHSHPSTPLAQLHMQKKQKKQPQMQLPQADFAKQNTAFIEIKELNQKIAQIQKLQKSYQGIQKELGEIQALTQKNHNKETLIQKIQNLHQRLDPILNEAFQQKLLLSSSHQIQEEKKNPNTLQRFLSQEEGFLKEKFNDYSQAIKTRFASQKEVSFNPEILKKQEFKTSHNPSLLNPNYSSILL